MNKRNYQREMEQVLVQEQNRLPRLLIHSCCAPCSSYVLEYLSKYFKILDDTFKLYGFSFKAEKKVKTSESLIQSAFLKGNTLEHILLIENNNISTNIHKDEVIKIKFEIDRQQFSYTAKRAIFNI